MSAKSMRIRTAVRAVLVGVASNKATSRIGAALVLSAVSTLTWSAPFSASFTALADDENSRSLNVNAAWQSADWLTLAGEVGSTSSRTPGGNLDGTTLGASAEARSEHVGLRGYYRNWNSNGLDSDTVGARAFFRTERLMLSIIGETRGLDVDYTAPGTTPQRATAHFAATGWGAGASYQWSHWGLYAEGISYRYGTLSRYVQTQAIAPDTAPTTSSGSGLPTLPLLPRGLAGSASAIGSSFPTLTQGLVNRAPALSGSYVTLNQGVFDHLLSAGVERRLARSSVRVDWNGVNDAVLDVEINSYSASYQYILSPRWTAGVTLGITESRYGSINFGGLSMGMTL